MRVWRRTSAPLRVRGGGGRAGAGIASAARPLAATRCRVRGVPIVRPYAGPSPAFSDGVPLASRHGELKDGSVKPIVKFSFSFVALMDPPTFTLWSPMV